MEDVTLATWRPKRMHKDGSRACTSVSSASERPASLATAACSRICLSALEFAQRRGSHPVSRRSNPSAAEFPDAVVLTISRVQIIHTFPLDCVCDRARPQDPPPRYCMTTKYGVFSEPAYLGTGFAATEAATAAGDAAGKEDHRPKPWVPATMHGTVGIEITYNEGRWLDG